MIKACCAALSLLVLANTPVQETFLELNSADACCCVFENQPLRQYASALCSIPIKIMSAVLNETSPSQAKRGHGKNKGHRKNTSSRYSLMANNSGAETQNNVKLQSRVSNEFLPAFNVLAAAADTGGASNPPGPPVEIIMFMLLLFVILPRSGISEAAVFLRPIK